MAGCKMKKGGSAKMSSGKSGAGVAPQVPAQFAAPKDINGFKKGGKVSAKHDDAAQDKKLISKMIAASEKKEPKEPAGMKKGGKVATKPSPKDSTKAHFDNVKVKHSYASSGAAVKKLPMKLAAGGAAKDRRGDFKNIKHQPKPKK